MKIYKQFLPKKIFSQLKKAMMGDYFPWYFNDYINKKKEKTKNFQFTFTFMTNNNYECWGKWQEIMIPVLKKIKHKKMNRVKANLLTRTNKIFEHKYHVDQKKGTTGILYLNNCNGYTIFENGKKITSEENKYVEFDSSLQHTGSSCTDEKRRVVINFNYEHI
tara:strand:- start:70 stop:558 length:489 start_codon:yes stop_codon:yes gene_type:complete